LSTHHDKLTCRQRIGNMGELLGRDDLSLKKKMMKSSERGTAGTAGMS